MYSCCGEDELSLKELKVCSDRPSDLDDATCGDNVSVLGLTDEITASVVVYAAEEGSKLTYRIYQKNTAGQYILQESLTQEKSLSEFEDKCGVRYADGWRTSTQWPEAEIKVEVELNSDPIQILSKEVELRN